MMVVCDGMGGHFRGDIGAQYVMEYTAKMFRKYANPVLTDPEDFLRKVLMGAHNGINSYAKKNSLKETPRTTCVICLVQNGMAWWANVGDSRLYFIRQGFLESKTKDQSYVQSLIDRGLISEDDAKIHPERNKILSCIGQDILPKIDIYPAFELYPGDTILVATDGLWGPLPTPFLCSVFSRFDVSISLPMLMNTAESITGKDSDNLSGVAFSWIGENAESTVQNDQNNMFCISENRLIFDEDVSLSIDMIRSAINHGF